MGTRIVLPGEYAGEYRKVFTRQRVELDREIGPEGVLGRFPVGVLAGME